MFLQKNSQIPQDNHVNISKRQNKISVEEDIRKEDAWMTIVEAIVLFLATWLNPQTGISIFALKLCFQILKTLRHHHRK